MRTSTFERVLPWSGALAGVLWGVQAFAATTPDDPTAPDGVRLVADGAALNYVSGFGMLAAGLLLVLFASAARAALRSGEAGEASYSSVAHGGLLVAAAGFAGFGVLLLALTNAARAGDPAQTTTLAWLAQVGWLPALVGLLAAFWGLGLGGLRTAALPKWFSVATVTLGAIGVLGPLAIVVYLVLPVWFVLASFVLASPTRVTAPVPAG